ncbi:hypothetical protein, partial [Bradyrhizobium sp.]|uniref:hypothetical protein n=1 Tax=Bradyrhizobium sp. TaxID=376 RepID=UPI00391A34C2
QGRARHLYALARMLQRHARLFAVLESIVARCLPEARAANLPAMKCPNVASCLFSQARASPSASGAEP